MSFIKALVSRYIDDEPQPGMVECVVVDAFGQAHLFAAPPINPLDARR
jgi:hypothetical protein